MVRGAKKGTFTATGKFSDGAYGYVKRRLDPKVIFIDGFAVENFMIDFNPGTSTAIKYEIKRIDSDYFAEE